MLLLNMRDIMDQEIPNIHFIHCQLVRLLNQTLRYIYRFKLSLPLVTSPNWMFKTYNEVSYFDNFTFNLTLKYLEHQKPKFGLSPKLNDFNYLIMFKIILFSPNWYHKTLIRCKNYILFHPILLNPYLIEKY